jgi:putative transposase
MAGAAIHDEWTNSYFVATAGGATLEVVKRYVENQRNV